MVCTNHRRIRIEFLEALGEPRSLLLDSSLTRTEVEIVPTPYNVLFAFGQHRAPLIQIESQLKLLEIPHTL